MRSKLLNTVFIFGLAFSTTAIAEGEAPTKAVGSGPNPFSDCGIGAALFPTIPVLAVTSNIIWDIGTTAVTSATASPETCSGKPVEAAAFINDTFENLAEETAKGEGEHLTALLNIYECDDSSRNAVVNTVRSGMALSLEQSSYDTLTRIEKAANYFEIINSSAAKECSA